MNDETRLWLSYAEENLQSAELLLESRLWNPCLQNAQRAVRLLFLPRSGKLTLARRFNGWKGMALSPRRVSDA